MGRLSMRDDKEPQIVINRARPISDFSQDSQEETSSLTGTLYLKLPSMESDLFGKIKAILSMFPGENPVVVYFADTKQRAGSRCALDAQMVAELKRVLGEMNVVIK